MPTKEQIQNFKNKLEKTKARLEKEVKELEVTPEFGSDIDHFEEEADEAEALSTNLGVAQALRERLENVEHALQKITTDKYGLCERCGKEIEMAIFNIDPESRYCKNCKLKK